MLEYRYQKGVKKKRKRFESEQIVIMLREAEIQMSKGLDVAGVCRNLSVSEQSYYRWRKEYGGMKLDQARISLKDYSSFLYSAVSRNIYTQITVLSLYLKRSEGG